MERIIAAYRQRHMPARLEPLTKEIVRVYCDAGMAWHTYKIDIEHRLSFDGEIVVDPHARRSGLSEKLIEAREDACKNMGVDIIIVDPLERSMWEHLGYAPLTPSVRKMIRKRDPDRQLHGGEYVKIIADAVQQQ